MAAEAPLQTQLTDHQLECVEALLDDPALPDAMRLDENRADLGESGEALFIGRGGQSVEFSYTPALPLKPNAMNSSRYLLGMISALSRIQNNSQGSRFMGELLIRTSKLVQHVMLALFCVLYSVHANAILLQIDPASSHVTYTPAYDFPWCFDLAGSVSCPTRPAPQTAALSGKMNLDIVHEHWEFLSEVTDRDLLVLNTVDFSAGALSPFFTVTGAVFVLSGGAFDRVSWDPCYLDPFPGLCHSTIMSSGGFSQDSGSWDGHTLTWIGHGSSGLFGDGYSFSLSAVPTPVPEPGTLALICLALIGLGVRRFSNEEAKSF